MQRTDEIERITSTFDGKFFIVASAAWVKPVLGNTRIVVTSTIIVAPPYSCSKDVIFFLIKDSCNTDLLDALQEGEAVARAHIDSLSADEWSATANYPIWIL